MGDTTMNTKQTIIIMATTAILATGCGADTTPTTEPTPSPTQQKHAIMTNAYANDETVFLYDAPQSNQIALFYADARIVYLKQRVLRMVKLTSNECLNLSVRERDDNGDWNTVYSFQSVLPGDYVLFDGSSWRVTQYTP